MQHLLTRINFYSTPNARGEAFSPFNPFINDIENKRSKLFPDRKRVPGRKTKYIIAVVYLIHIYAFAKFLQQKRIYQNKADQQRHVQRRMAPFFQSIEDIQFTTLKHRNDLIMIEAFKGKGGAAYLEKFNRFSTDDVFVPSNGGGVQTEWQKAGTTRYVDSMMGNANNRYLTGYNIQNI